jgi:hypothetical protein
MEPATVDTASPLRSRGRPEMPTSIANTAINAVALQGRPLSALGVVAAADHLRPPFPTAKFRFEAGRMPVLLNVFSISQSYMTDMTTPESKVVTKVMQTIAALSVALMVIGLVVGFIYPGPITGVLLPLGLTLWCLVGLFVRWQESSVTS